MARNLQFWLMTMVLMIGGCYKPSIDIWEAVRTSNKNAVSYHIEHGIDVNSTLNGSTLLHCAGQKSTVEIAALLIMKGANVNTRNGLGWTPLDIAIQNGNKDMANILRKHGGKMGEELPSLTIFHAIRKGKISEVRRFLDERIDIDTKASGGLTPLLLAVREGKVDIIKLLIQRGAKINPRENGGWTPLDFAIAEKKNEIIDLLLKYGAKTEKELPTESIYDAIERGDISYVKKYIDRGVDINSFWQRSLFGNIKITLLDKAIGYKREDIVALLRKHGAKTGKELEEENKE